MSEIPNNIFKTIKNDIFKRRQTCHKSQNNEPLSINNLLSNYKITTIKSVINKFNKLYMLCKSKKIDKFHKYRVISHKLNTIVKKCVLKSLEKNYKNRLCKYKRKIRKKSNQKIFDQKEDIIDKDIVRNKIREQLDLLRNFKRTNPPLLTLKSKINSKSESTCDNKSINQIEIIQPISPKPSTSYENIKLNNIVENSIKNLDSPVEDKITEDKCSKSDNDTAENSLISEVFRGDSSSVIKPTKTNDITKIKGWRGKQFLKTNFDSQQITTIGNVDKTIDDKSMDLPETLEVSTKSAFESEALDKFLTNAKLNISYEVPKLIAEEAISKIDDYKVMSSQNSNPTIKTIAKIPDKKCKAKTLAEKRKMIENDRQKDLLHEMEINETTLLKQLKRDEKRHRIETINEIRNTLKNQLMPISRECWKTAMKSENNQSVSQIITNSNENIQIIGSFDDVAIRITENLIRTEHKNLYYQNVQIVDEISFKEIKPNYKALFNDSTCKYKPGPLSKKPFLDQLKNNLWETVVVSLPKIILEVHSECGKEMDPKIQPYLQTQVSEKGFISDIWANFAASAVNRNKKNIFDFPLKYSNDQHKVLMKRKKMFKNQTYTNDTNDNLDKAEKTETQPPISPENCSVEFQVKCVVNNILKYLETPVLDNSNINYCPDCPKFEESDSSLLPITQVSDDVHAILSTSRKRKLPSLLKTERELKRLSVQVIEVDMQPETKTKRAKNEKCTRVECRLGCICYDSDVEWPQHCGREGCILQCQCRSVKISDKQRNHQYITLPEGANILSAKTMGHIRDQAHKNLAKEERKFTQTVIKANDQTIVVGEGCRERRKRVKKIPKKYTEYVKNCAELKKIHNLETEQPEQPQPKINKRSLRIWGNEDKSNESSENLNKPINVKSDPNTSPIVLKQEIVPILENMIQLKNVLSWCMVHNLYKCFCNGQALEDILNQKPKKLNTEREEVDGNEEYIAYTSKRTYAAANPFANSEINVSARVRGVPNFYLNRNKSQYFKTRNIEIREKEKDYNYFNTSLNEDENSTDSFIDINKYYPVEIKLSFSTNSIQKLDKIQTLENVENAKDKNEKEIHDNSRSIRRKTSSRKYSNSEFIAEFSKITDKEKSLLHKYKTSARSTSTESKIIKKDTRKDNTTKPLKSDISKKISSPNIERNNSTNTENKIVNNVVVAQIDPQKPLLVAKTFMLPDLLVPMPHIQNHFRSMVFKTTSSTHVFRLMQWEKLNEHFQKSSVYIWYNPKGVSGKLIATKSVIDRPSDNYIDVKYFKNMTTELPDVVKGLIQGKLPGRAFDSKNTYGIFVFNGQYWEIRGTILKKPTDSPIIKEDEKVKEIKPLENVPDVANPVKELHLESKEIPLAVAEPELYVDSKSSSTPASIRVPIPIGMKDSRWFMLILENDFSVLRVANSIVTIKYSQLKQACQFAMRVARTVRFLIPRNNKPNDNNHPAYGGYAVPGLLERIFFGPYDLVEGHGIMTYRYLNGKLVDTKLVDHLTGSGTKKSKGIWLYTKGGHMMEMNSQIQDNSSIPTVDLTENDESDNNILNQKWDSIEENKTNSIRFELSAPETGTNKVSNSSNKISNNNLLPFKSSNKQISTKSSNLIPNKYFNNSSEVAMNKIEIPMPVLEKIDSQINVSKPIIEMPKLHPISSPIVNNNSPVENNLKETINPLPIYYTSRRNPALKRKRKSQLQEICNDDDLEIISSTISTKPKERTMWLVSEPKNLGYIEIKTHLNGRISLKSPINQQELEFNEMSAAIDWIDKILRRFVHFVPIDFQIRMFLVEDEKALVNRQPLKETELRGHHVICKKGLFDLTELTSNDIDDLGISIRERDKLLERQPTLILQKYIYKLGDTFLPVETMRSMLHETIINMASPAIRRLQKENIKLKKEKRDCLLQSQVLQKKLNVLSKSLDFNNRVKPFKFGADLDNDDDVILIEDDDENPLEIAKDIEKDPLELPQDNLVISNVTSLAENYIDNNHSDTPIVESMNQSCKIIDDKIQKISESSQPKLATPKYTTYVDPKKLQITSPDNTKTPVYAPVVLPDGRSILIPIEPSNTNRKIVVSDNQSKKYKIRITPIPSRKKPVSLLNSTLKSNSQKNYKLAAPALKMLTTKSSKPVSSVQSILKNNSEMSGNNNNNINNTSNTMPEVIEID